MITFSNLGKKGNLGNQLFQIASTIGIAKKNHQEVCFPAWEHSDTFDCQFHHCPSINDWITVKEKQFSFHEWPLQHGNYDLNGWLQTEKYFYDANIREVFTFKPEFENQLLEKYKKLFARPSILISVRRGDFVNNPDYFQLNYKFYLTALLHHFEQSETYNIIFASDSIAYCKKHFSFLPNVHFLDDLKPIEQLCLASKMDHYIISNSTFSWWLAWLGEKEGTKIIRPMQVFDGKYSEMYDESDYFPERWLAHDTGKFGLPNTYLKLKIYGYLYEVKERMIYLTKKNKKRIKSIIKEIVRR